MIVSTTSSKQSRGMILAILAVVILFMPFPSNVVTPTQRIFKIQASQFQYMPADLNVNLGDQVTIELIAMDVVHGFSIDGYNIQTASDPGQTARLTFVASKQGTFRFRCTTTCGSLHPFMIGKLHVGKNIFLWRGVALTILAFVGVDWILKP